MLPPASMYDKLSIFILFSGGCIIIKSLAPYFSSYYHRWSSQSHAHCDQKFIRTLSCADVCSLTIFILKFFMYRNKNIIPKRWGRLMAILLIRYDTSWNNIFDMRFSFHVRGCRCYFREFLPSANKEKKFLTTHWWLFWHIVDV
jgi:hypothetical protein